MNVTTQQELTELAAKTIEYVNHDSAIADCEGTWSGGKFICAKMNDGSVQFVASGKRGVIEARFAQVDSVVYQLSLLHVAIIGDQEYFYSKMGDLMKAHLSNNVGTNGVRMGGRFESTAVTAPQALKFARELAAKV